MLSSVWPRGHASLGGRRRDSPRAVVAAEHTMRARGRKVRPQPREGPIRSRGSRSHQPFRIPLNRRGLPPTVSRSGAKPLTCIGGSMSRIRFTASLIIAMALVAAAAALSGTTPAGTPAAAKPAGASTDAAAKAKMIARGKHLTVVSVCGDCHPPGPLFGAPDFSRELSGSELGWQGPWGTSYARNLTPDMETGLGKYKEEDIVNAIKGGHRLDGSPMLPPMPWQNYATYSDADLHAIVAYLKSLPAVKHAVPDRVPPTAQATDSLVT